MASGDAVALLQAIEHNLHAAAALGSALLVSDRSVAGSPTWDAGVEAFGFQGTPEPVGIIGAIAKQPLRLEQVFQQGFRASLVADLRGGHEQAERAAVGICDGLRLDVRATFG